MLKQNSMITDAAAALQAAFTAEDSTPEIVQAAFDKFGQAIAATVQADFESANGDRNILAQRGFRQLTAPEQKYYEQIIKAGKASNPKQAYEGLLDSTRIWCRSIRCWQRSTSSPWHISPDGS